MYKQNIENEKKNEEYIKNILQITFNSTASTRYSNIGKYLYTSCCLLQILLPKGSNVLFINHELSTYGHDSHEIVLPVGCTFKFTINNFKNNFEIKHHNNINSSLKNTLNPRILPIGYFKPQFKDLIFELKHINNNIAFKRSSVQYGMCLNDLHLKYKYVYCFLADYIKPDSEYIKNTINTITIKNTNLNAKKMKNIVTSINRLIDTYEQVNKEQKKKDTILGGSYLKKCKRKKKHK